MLVFNTDILINANLWFQSIGNMFSNFFQKAENKDIEMINLIKDKESN
jgi:hypothetical protein